MAKAMPPFAAGDGARAGLNRPARIEARLRARRSIERRAGLLSPGDRNDAATAYFRHLRDCCATSCRHGVLISVWREASLRDIDPRVVDPGLRPLFH